MQSDGSIMCWFYCISFIEYMIAGKSFLDHTNLFSLNDFKKNDKIIYKYFKYKYDKRKRKSWLETKKIDETRNYLLEETKRDNLMSEEHKKV